MTQGAAYATGALGGCLIVFGVFLLAWRRAGPSWRGRNLVAAGWVILVLGIALAIFALLVPAAPGPGPGLPPPAAG